MTLEQTFGMNQNSLKMYVVLLFSGRISCFLEVSLELLHKGGICKVYIYIFIYRTDVHFHKPKVSEDAVHA